MPQSPSKSPSSQKQPTSGAENQKTRRSGVFGSPGTITDSLSIKDPSVVSVKSPRYPPSQTAQLVHINNSTIKEAPTMKSPSRASLSGGFKFPLLQESGKIPYTNSQNSASPTSSPSAPPPISSAANPFNAAASTQQNGSLITGKTTSPPVFTDPVLTIASNKQPEVVATPDRPKHSDSPVSTGIKLEFSLALAASLVFLSLWILLMVANCYNHLELIFWVKAFSLVGAITGVFVSVYCCFEKNLSPRTGMTGCLFITCVVVVICLNLIGAYLTVAKCICKCEQNPLKDGREDFYIFMLELFGSAFLVLVLIVAVATQQNT